MMLLFGNISGQTVPKKSSLAVEEYPFPRAQFPFEDELWEDRSALAEGAEANLRFMASVEGQKAYRFFEEEGISQARVEQSLQRFVELLRTAASSGDLALLLHREFALFRSRGRDGQGTVRFTGYFQPVFKASLERTREYIYPIYRLPSDFERWQKPHPTRVKLEGYDGRGGAKTLLRSHELAYLRSRYEVFTIQLQGSAILELPDRSRMAVGFAGGTDYPFRGISKEFLQTNRVAWQDLDRFFEKQPALLNEVMSRNNRFIFFKENDQPLPIGSLGLPVMPERSIATDKVKLPPGAVGIIRAPLPQDTPGGKVTVVTRTRFVLDQDAGSAIKGPGRVDVFMGTGSEAQRKANHLLSDGELYYLLLRTWREEQKS
jgi:membrane-bound lytic murein transglycosylase A